MLSLLNRLQQSGDAWQRLLHLVIPVVYQWGRERGLQDTDRPPGLTLLEE